MACVQPVPAPASSACQCAVGKAPGRQAGGHLQQRALQPREHRSFPRAAHTDPAAIEVEHVDVVARANEQVVRVQVRVLHAARMQRTDALADRMPRFVRQGRLLQRLGQRTAHRQFCGDQIGAVKESGTLIPGRYRRGHGQPPGSQLAQQAPLRKRARAVGAGPHVEVVRESGNESAAAIVAQHPAPALARAHEGNRAAPATSRLERALRPPVRRIEHRSVRMVETGGIV